MFNREIAQQVMYRALTNSGMSHKDAMRYSSNPEAVADLQAAFNNEYYSGREEGITIGKNQAEVPYEQPFTANNKLAQEVILSHFGTDGMLRIQKANEALQYRMAYKQAKGVDSKVSYALLVDTMTKMGFTSANTSLHYWNKMLTQFITQNIANDGFINKIEAIKDMRTHFTNIGLRSAKEAIEAKMTQLETSHQICAQQYVATR